MWWLVQSQGPWAACPGPRGTADALARLALTSRQMDWPAVRPSGSGQRTEQRRMAEGTHWTSAEDEGNCVTACCSRFSNSGCAARSSCRQAVSWLCSKRDYKPEYGPNVLSALIVERLSTLVSDNSVSSYGICVHVKDHKASCLLRIIGIKTSASTFDFFVLSSDVTVIGLPGYQLIVLLPVWRTKQRAMKTFLTMPEIKKYSVKCR